MLARQRGQRSIWWKHVSQTQRCLQFSRTVLFASRQTTHSFSYSIDVLYGRCHPCMCPQVVQSMSRVTTPVNIVQLQLVKTHSCRNGSCIIHLQHGLNIVVWDMRVTKFLFILNEQSGDSEWMKWAYEPSVWYGALIWVRTTDFTGVCTIPRF